VSTVVTVYKIGNGPELHIEVEFPPKPRPSTSSPPRWAHTPGSTTPDTPGRDNDGVNAVTLTLPDLDGTVRAHPH
jgi:hypothetical protein